MKYIKKFEAARDPRVKLLVDAICDFMKAAFKELEIPNTLKVSSYDIKVFYKEKNRKTGVIENDSDSIMHLHRQAKENIISLMFFEYSVDGGWGGLWQDPKLTTIYNMMKSYIGHKEGIIFFKDEIYWKGDKTRHVNINFDYIDDFIQYFKELIDYIPVYLNSTKYNL